MRKVMILVIEIVIIIVAVLISGSHGDNIYYSDCDKLMMINDGVSGCCRMIVII